MNAAATAPVESTACFHCGDALGADAVGTRINGELHDFC